MDPQLPEEVFKIKNILSALILIEFSSKQQISLLPTISAPQDEQNTHFHTSNGQSMVEDI